VDRRAQFGGIVRLLRSDEPVTFRNDRWDLREARLRLRLYSDFDICAAGVASPAGPRPAGRRGLGLVSIGATPAAGFDALAHNRADREATRRSYELIARHVMPHFQGQRLPAIDSAARAEKLRPDLAAKHAEAVEDMKARYATEVAARALTSRPRRDGGAGLIERERAAA